MVLQMNESADIMSYVRIYPLKRRKSSFYWQINSGTMAAMEKDKFKNLGDGLDLAKQFDKSFPMEDYTLLSVKILK